MASALQHERAFAALADATAAALRPGALVRVAGTVMGATPAGVEVMGMSRHVKLGDLVWLGSVPPTLAETVAIAEAQIVIKPFETAAAVAIGTPVWTAGQLDVCPSPGWKGRLIDALAQPIDGRGPLPRGPLAVPLLAKPPPAVARASLGEPLRTGVKAIDVFTPLCHGQRVGIFAGSGVGKSTLLGMLARAPGFDTVVVALVGERGREVGEFVRDILGEALGNAVVVVSTSDESAPRRKLAPILATTLAEYFRDLGQRVLLIMDSVTRYAQAAREVALAGGEPPVARGFPPSVFTALPQLLERAGAGVAGTGSITGIYSVLVDGDNHNDPVADAVRGTLDGHIVLDRTIAAGGRFPAVDVLGSVSRLSHKAWTAAEAKQAADFRRLISRYEDTRDLRAIGGYQAGQDLDLDRAMAAAPRLLAALHQGGQEPPCPDAFGVLAAALRSPDAREGKPQAAQAADFSRPTS